MAAGVFLFAALGWAQPAFQLASSPTPVCVSAATLVSDVALVAMNSGTVNAGTNIVYTFRNNVALTPVVSGVPATVSIAANRVSVVVTSSTTFLPGGTITLSGIRLDLRGALLPVTVAVSGINVAAISTVDVATLESFTVSPGALTFSSQLGAPAPPFGVFVLTAPTFTWTAAPSTVTGGAWLSVTPLAGTGNRTFMVQVNPAGLALGSYQGAIDLTASSSVCASVSVRYDITPPILSVNAASLVYTGPAGAPGSSFAGRLLTVSGPNLSWTSGSSTTSGGDWLKVSTTSGTTPSSVLVTVEPAGLAIGTYQGSITYSSAQASNPPVTVQVILNITVPPAIALTPPSLTFVANRGGLAPPAQQLTISNAGSGVFNWTAIANTAAGGNWLAVSPGAGANGQTITVSVNPAGLPAGAYLGSVQILSAQATNSPQTLNVQFNVVDGVAVIRPSPAELRFITSAPSPVTQTVEIANAGAGTFGWTAAAATLAGGSWLSVSPTTAAEPGTLRVTVDPTGLAPGAYVGSVTITATPGSLASNSPQVIPVVLAYAAPAISAGGVVNGASFARDRVVAPGGIVAIFGERFSELADRASSLPLPTTLADSQVLVNGQQLAPLFFMSPGQINAQMPFGLSETSAAITVVSGGVRGLTETVQLAAEAPGIFTIASSGAGQGAVLNQDGTLNSAANPAAAGSTIQIFATGLGVVLPAVAAGAPAPSSPPSSTRLTPLVTIGGQQAEVLFSGLAPGFAGLYQVNARVPSGAPAGAAVALQIHAGARSSNQVTFAIR
jgi:uncharacterized protein (TIGR03437 family)